MTEVFPVGRNYVREGRGVFTYLVCRPLVELTRVKLNVHTYTFFIAFPALTTSPHLVAGKSREGGVPKRRPRRRKGPWTRAPGASIQEALTTSGPEEAQFIERLRIGILFIESEIRTSKFRKGTRSNHPNFTPKFPPFHLSTPCPPPPSPYRLQKAYSCTWQATM